ncbi:hypothetical protein [Jiangella alkaliphila]|uniref:hypothetical protein n=1 Tax=Jiangella alkaliphila TaxID=419479 RepID=UPI0006299BAB|nr:hypothetical protein [Jiangella alkaliphila]
MARAARHPGTRDAGDQLHDHHRYGYADHPAAHTVGRVSALGGRAYWSGGDVTHPQQRLVDRPRVIDPDGVLDDPTGAEPVDGGDVAPIGCGVCVSAVTDG